MAEGLWSIVVTAIIMIIHPGSVTLPSSTIIMTLQMTLYDKLFAFLEISSSEMAVGHSLSKLIISSHLFLCIAIVEPHIDQPCIIYASKSFGQVVDTLPGNCADLDTALDWLSSDVTIMLEEGTYLINRSHQMDIRGASNIKIIGAGVNVTMITCADQNGLAFVGITNLTFVNFTIIDCGLSGSNMAYHITLLSEVLDLWFMIPPATKIALFLGQCTNVMIEDVNITETAGLGFLGINILGMSSIKRSGYISNISPKCHKESPQIIPSPINSDIHDQVGGGAFFLYADIFKSSSIESEVKLLLSELYFAHNTDCTFAANTIMNFPYFIKGPTNHPLYNYSIGAGGGLSVFLSNSDFEVAVDVYDSIFYQNEARHGGGAFVATFAGFQNPLAVTFNGCIFKENGLNAMYDSIETRGCCKGGAGLAIFTDLLKPKHFLTGIPAAHIQFIFEMFTTEFVNNAAQVQGGGIFAYSLQKTQQQLPSDNEAKKFYLIAWSFINISFNNNSALYGSAGFFYQMAEFSFDGFVMLKLANITARTNHNQAVGSNHEGGGSTIHIKNIVGELTDVTLENNVGSAMRLDSTVVYIRPSARLIFRSNTAYRGGALYLSGHSPALIVDKNCSLQFEQNTAHMEGGAIYYSKPDLVADISQSYNLRGCFLLTPFSPTQFYERSGILNLGINLLFKNNHAPIGSTIYGSSLESCSWAENLMLGSEENISLYSKLYRKYKNIFSFDYDPIVELFISTPPASISVKTSKEEPLQAYPGQALPIEIKVLNFYNVTIPALVTTAVKETPRTKSSLRESGFWYTDIANTTLSVVSAETGLVAVSIIATESLVSTRVSVNLSSCPIGFELNQENLRCKCSDLFRNQTMVTCHTNSISFEVLGNFWIGVDPTIEEPTSEDLIISRCVFNYCRESRNSMRNVLPAQIDTQCNHQRTGILCGSCNRKEGYSSILGSNECLKCSNYMIFLTIVFVIAGAALFSGIFFLEITIDKGWTNSVIFFCSIMSSYDYLVFDPSYSYIFFPAHLLNLQSGVGLCFYDGMTSLSRTGLQLLLPLYLYVLMVVFTILCKQYSWMSTHFSPAKTLMTLSVICYMNVLTTCVELVGVVRIDTFGGLNSSYRWYSDPNQVYFQGLHALFCAIGIVIILIYLIPFPIILLFPNLAYKYMVRFTPLLDALWAAYKPKYRFWFGLRLMSIAVFLLFTRLPERFGISIGGIYAVLFFQIQGTVLPFKDKVANRADAFFLTIVLLFYWGYLCRVTLSFSHPTMILANVFLSVITTSSYLVIILLFIFHLHQKFPCLWQKLHPCLFVCFETFFWRRKREDKTVHVENEASIVSVDNDVSCRSPQVREHHHSQSIVTSHRESNLHFRESMLDFT